MASTFLGHLACQLLSRLPHILVGSPLSKSLCDVCCRAKHTCSALPSSTSCVSDIFALIHCDIWGSYRSSIFSGATYFLSVLDDYSRAIWVYLSMI